MGKRFPAFSAPSGPVGRFGQQCAEKRARRKKEHAEPAVFLGGRLNEDIEGEEAVDVRSRLEELGIHAPQTLPDMVSRVRGAVAEITRE